jgi:hypothetical protein
MSNLQAFIPDYLQEIRMVPRAKPAGETRAAAHPQRTR